MIPRLRVTLWLLLFLSSAPYFAGRDSWGLAERYERSLTRQLNFIIAKHPRYAWGGAEDLQKGLDCSGYIFLAAKWAAIPGITRTTAYRMSQGLGGWNGRDIVLDSARQCDLVFWTFVPARLHGHVGAILRDRQGLHKVTHSSARRGVVLDRLEGLSLRSLTGIRRLTIGD
ncbi:MAG: NlpC/P60 family protein [Desulfomonile sp.]